MLSPIPAPSKGALRLLRRLAFAGSFGGTAVIAEDRQRRICAARQIHDNARKLKTSRCYHSAGVAVAELPHDGFFEGHGRKDVELKWSEEPDVVQRHFLPSEVEKAYHSVEGEESKPLAKAPQNTKQESNVQQHTLSEDGKPRDRHPHLAIEVAARLETIGSTSTPTKDGVSGRVEIPEHQLTLLQRFTRRMNSHLDAGRPVLAKKELWRFFSCSKSSATSIDTPLQQAVLRMLADLEKYGNFLQAWQVHDKIREYDFNLVHEESPLQTIETLLEESKIAEATRLFKYTFLTKMQPSKQFLHGRVTDLASILSLKTLKAGLYHYTEQIFWRLDYYQLMDPVCWEATLKALLEQQKYRDVVVLYRRYSEEFRNSYSATASMCRALVALSRLDKAEELLKFLSPLQNSRLGESGLGGCYAILLGATWRSTKDLAHTKNLFDDMQTWSGTHSSSVPLYNTIVQCCVEAGCEDQAQHYFHEMTEKKGLLPDLQTYGSLVLAHAQRHDWDGMDYALQKVQDLGNAMEFKGAVAKAFNRTFKILCRTLSAAASHALLQAVMEKYGLVPDSETSDIMIKRYLEAKDLESISRWLDTIRRFDMRLDASTVSSMFEVYWQVNHLDHEHLWRFYNVLKKFDKDLISQKFLDTISDAIAYDSTRKGSRFSSNDLRIAGRLERVNQEGKPRQKRKGRYLLLQMRIAMARNRPIEAVSLYADAKKRGAVITNQDLKTVIEASVALNDGDCTEAFVILESAQRSHMDISHALTPILLSRLENSDLSDKALIASSLDFYKSLEDHNLPIKHHVAVSTANKFIDEDKPRAALELLTWIMNSPMMDHAPLDIVPMTVFLRAYATLADLVGAKWVIDTVLNKNMRIDDYFIKTLQDARRPIRKLQKQMGEDSILWNNSQRLLDQLHGWTIELRERKNQMEADAIAQGKALVKVIKRHSRDQKRRDMVIQLKSTIPKIRFMGNVERVIYVRA